VARTPKFWRLRAKDIGGNVSAWSNVNSFRVVFDDRIDHGGGDADKVCGFGVPAGGGAPLSAVVAAALLAGAAMRRRR
jgi:MYXO-CTERM domain-containing protein